jgi:hypothetical protein
VPEPAQIANIPQSALERAQCVADRVWAGQSSDVKRGERIRRVKFALEEQGLPAEGVIYPGSA